MLCFALLCFAGFLRCRSKGVAGHCFAGWMARWTAATGSNAARPLVLRVNKSRGTYHIGYKSRISPGRPRQAHPLGGTERHDDWPVSWLDVFCMALCRALDMFRCGVVCVSAPALIMCCRLYCCPFFHVALLCLTLC